MQGKLDGDRYGLFAISRLTGTVQLIGPGGTYDTHPSADSVLLVPVRRLGKGVAFVISLASGAIVDSVHLPFDWARDVSWSPDARHIAASTTNGITVVDRAGVQTGSLNISNRSTLRWSPDGRALLTFRTGAVREDELMRITMTRDGTPQGNAELVMSRVPMLYVGRFDLARRSGRLVLATGDAIGDIWSFDLTARPVQGRPEARGTTWYGEPALSLDGKSIFYFRGDALGDNVYMLDRATGREEALTAQRLPGMNRVQPSADGRRLVYARHRDVGTRIEYMEFPSRRVLVDTTGARLEVVIPVVPDALLGQRYDDGALLLKESSRGGWKTIPIPDSIVVMSFAPSPDGVLLAFTGLATSESGEQRMRTRPSSGDSRAASTSARARASCSPSCRSPAAPCGWRRCWIRTSRRRP